MSDVEEAPGATPPQPSPAVAGEGVEALAVIYADAFLAIVD